MIVRKVLITAKENLANIDEFRNNPYVVKYWDLPRDQVLFEFFHPVFRHTRSTERVFLNESQMDSLRVAASDAVAAEQELLSPLYQTVSKPQDALMMLVPSQSSMYEFVGRNKGIMDWPDLGCSLGWEQRKQFRFAGGIRRELIGSKSTPWDAVLTQWIDAMSQKGVQIQRGQTANADNYFSVTLSSNEPAGDAIMALYMLLTLTARETGLERIGYFDGQDFSIEFWEIGGPRRSSQLLF